MRQQQQRYKVLERIAAGGMAEVFRAESAGLEGFKKVVAIKRVLPHLAGKKPFIGMFLDEARVGAQLSHSNCVQVFDIGVGDNTYFIVMEYVDGADLKTLVEHRHKVNQPLALEEACLICVKICEGLAYAHELEDSSGKPMGVVHRDMSPPNVLITRHGEVKIADFGLSKASSHLEQSEPGVIKGKFSYLSPEAAQGRPVDARTDIFAVGIILWELLAGRRLFAGNTDLETVHLVQAAVVPPIRQFNPKVSVELERVLARALARELSQRYAAARDLGRELNNILFRLGRAVSSFDIARLVEPIRAEREERKRRERLDKKSRIGSLIQETLFEFTSLGQHEHGAPVSSAGATPLSLGGLKSAQELTSDFANAVSNQPSARVSSGFGNLSSLEDDTPALPRSTSPRSSRPQPAPPPASPNHLQYQQPTPQSSLGSQRLLMVVAFLAVLALVVALVRRF